MKHPVIALITDFGTDDVYVGVMKGAILSISPDADIVDITHAIPRHDILAGSHTLLASYPFFPEGSIFVAVVDPGVGGDRAVLCARAEARYFLAPDNGLLGQILSEKGYEALVRVEREDLFIKPVSSTFHGRDIFAPVAAHISMGLDIKSLGPEVADYMRLESAGPEVGPGRIAARVAWVDSFGNIVTNCPAEAAEEVVADWASIGIEGRGEEISLVRSYDSVPEGALLAIVGSSGFLELSVREGSAAERLGIEPGDAVVLLKSKGE